LKGSEIAKAKKRHHAKASAQISGGYLLNSPRSGEKRKSQPGTDKYRKVFVELAKRVRSLKIEQQREKYKAKIHARAWMCVKYRISQF